MVHRATDDDFPIDDALGTLREYGFINRKRVNLALSLIALVVVALIGVVYLYVKVDANSRAIRTVCQVEHKLWEPVLEDTKKHPRVVSDPAERERSERIAKQFEETLNRCKP